MRSCRLTKRSASAWSSACNTRIAKASKPFPIGRTFFQRTCIRSYRARPSRSVSSTCSRTSRARASPRPRVHWALGPSAPERCSSALMARTMELARRYDIPVYSHIYESRGMALQARLTLPEHGGSLIKRLAAEGALDPLLNLAHSVWLARDEIDLLAATGTGVVLNPQGNLKMKCGIPPIRGLQDAGVRIGLGCDNCSY